MSKFAFCTSARLAGLAQVRAAAAVLGGMLYQRINDMARLSARKNRKNPAARNTKQYWDMVALQVSYS